MARGNARGLWEGLGQDCKGLRVSRVASRGSHSSQRTLLGLPSFQTPVGLRSNYACRSSLRGAREDWTFTEHLLSTRHVLHTLCVLP